jgi:hypothetical protein
MVKFSTYVQTLAAAYDQLQYFTASENEWFTHIHFTQRYCPQDALVAETNRQSHSETIS